MNIYVGNLPYNMDEFSLRALFEPHGEVKSANVIIDRETGRSRGFGFVEMDDSSSASQAIEALDGHDLEGRALRVNEAKPREPRSGGGGGGNRGRGGGGFGGGGGGRSREKRGGGHRGRQDDWGGGSEREGGNW